jgi:hypothetical protein
MFTRVTECNQEWKEYLLVSRLSSSSARKRGVNLYKCFIDLTKAYDKVNREILWEVLKHRGVPSGMINLIKGMHKGAQASLRIKGEIVSQFPLNTGLKQGSSFSPLFFNIFFGVIIDIWKKEVEALGVDILVRINGNFLDAKNFKGKEVGCTMEQLFELLFADDAEIVATFPKDLQSMVDAFVKVTKAFGQEVSVKKSKVMVILKKNEVYDAENPLVIKVNDEKLEVVDSFAYVGNFQNSWGTMDHHMNRTLSKLGSAYNSMAKRVFEHRKIRLKSWPLPMGCMVAQLETSLNLN